MYFLLGEIHGATKKLLGTCGTFLLGKVKCSAHEERLKNTPIALNAGRGMQCCSTCIISLIGT